jgi:hypothetical protein
VYCWPPLPLIYIEEGESPFFHSLIVVHLVFRDGALGFHEETLGRMW